MPKKEMEFFDVDKIEWKPIKNAPGTWERILSADRESGSYTRMLKFDPGTETYETLTHDFWEEVYIIKGGLIDKGKGNQIYREGMYACRPPGMPHGPYAAPIGCVTIEMRYFQAKHEAKTR